MSSKISKKWKSTVHKVAVNHFVASSTGIRKAIQELEGKEGATCCQKWNRKKRICCSWWGKCYFKMRKESVCIRVIWKSTCSYRHSNFLFVDFFFELSCMEL